MSSEEEILAKHSADRELVVRVRNWLSNNDFEVGVDSKFGEDRVRDVAMYFYKSKKRVQDFDVDVFDGEFVCPKQFCRCLFNLYSADRQLTKWQKDPFVVKAQLAGNFMVVRRLLYPGMFGGRNNPNEVVLTYLLVHVDRVYDLISAHMPKIKDAQKRFDAFRARNPDLRALLAPKETPLENFEMFLRQTDEYLGPQGRREVLMFRRKKQQAVWREQIDVVCADFQQKIQDIDPGFRPDLGALKRFVIDSHKDWYGYDL